LEACGRMKCCWTFPCLPYWSNEWWCSVKPACSPQQRLPMLWFNCLQHQGNSMTM
jgi:hypothetical protein